MNEHFELGFWITALIVTLLLAFWSQQIDKYYQCVRESRDAAHGDGYDRHNDF